MYYFDIFVGLSILQITSYVRFRYSGLIITDLLAKNHRTSRQWLPLVSVQYSGLDGWISANMTRAITVVDMDFWYTHPVLGLQLGSFGIQMWGDATGYGESIITNHWD